jgi:hypothetical protein
MRLLWPLLLLSFITFNSGLDLQESDLELLDGQPQQGLVQGAEETFVYHVVLNNNTSSVKVKIIAS